MGRPVIEVEGLSKLYRLGATVRHDTLRDTIAHGFGRLAGRGHAGAGNGGNGADSLWALKDVTFDVHEGEVLGIIGRNGAGKSTLLKLLSRITDPTCGRAVMRGRVASLLEVGTGFHPELTGAENIYQNGAILGMSRAEIKARFDEIVAFAEVEKFLDTPVKRYSSGMYVRLAFAVAAHLEPEILIVDEVLAVGDAAFQKKCMGKMEDVSRSGRTILFVSHNMGSIKQLCSRALLLDKGMTVLNGGAAEAVERYFSMYMGGDIPTYSWDEAASPGDDGARLRSIRVCTGEGETVSEFSSAEPVFVEVAYRLLKPHPMFRVGYSLHAADGTYVYYSSDDDMPEYSGKLRREGHYVSRCRIPGDLLNAGSYYVAVSGGVFGVRSVFHNLPFLRFAVVSAGGPTSRFGEVRRGAICPVLDWDVRVEGKSFPDEAGPASGRHE